MGEQCCKVGRVISQYDLTSPTQYSGSLDDYLVAKWKGKGHHSEIGYRQLAEWFNKHCLQSVYRRHGRTDTKALLDAEYEALNGDKVAPHDRQEVIADLRSDGIDGEQLAGDFISKSTLSRHLRQCLEVTKDRQREAAETEWETNQIEYAREKFHDQIDEALSSLDSKDRIVDGQDATVSVQITLSCPECPTRVSLETALQQGCVCTDHATTTGETTGRLK